MENFLFIGFFVLLGLLCARLDLFPRDAAQTLNVVALYLALPALILLQAPQITFSRDALVAALLPWGALLLSVALVLLGARLWQWPRSIVGVLLLLVPLGNTSFLGVPMIQAFFGAGGLPFLIVYDQFGTMAIFATYGALILALYGRKAGTDVATVARRVLLFPPTLALVVGLAARSWPYPEILTRLLQNLSVMLVPLVMVAIGLQLRLKLERRVLRPLSFGLAVKLLAAPLLLWLGCRLAGIASLAADVAIVEAGMPPMVTAGALAVAAGLEADLAVALVGLGIACSFVSLPLLFRLTQLVL